MATPPRIFKFILDRFRQPSGGVQFDPSWLAGGTTAVSATAPITSTGGATPAIGISPASSSTAGSMSIGDFNKLAAATAANTPATIVLRDGSGDVAFGTATGSRVTGLAAPQAGSDAVNKTYADQPTPIAGSLVNPSGVSVVDFSIPAGVRRITLLSSGIITLAGGLVRFGTSGGVATTGYNSSTSFVGSSSGTRANSTVGLQVPECLQAMHWCMTFYRVSANSWNFTGQSMYSNTDTFIFLTAGGIQLPDELTTLRFINPETMTAGSLRLLLEY